MKLFWNEYEIVLLKSFKCISMFEFKSLYEKKLYVVSCICYYNWKYLIHEIVLIFLIKL